MSDADTIEENKLPKVEQYDTAIHMAIPDIVSMTQNQMPESKARALLSLYCVEPVAERKVPKTRGRGLHLFARTDVEKVLGHYLSFFSGK